MTRDCPGHAGVKTVEDIDAVDVLERRALVGNNIGNSNVGATVDVSIVFPYVVVATCVNAVRGALEPHLMHPMNFSSLDT